MNAYRIYRLTNELDSALRTINIGIETVANNGPLLQAADELCNIALDINKACIYSKELTQIPKFAQDGIKRYI